MLGRNAAYKGIRIAAYLWAAPCSVVGLLLFLPALLFGASTRFTEGVMEISLARFLRRIGRLRLPFRAITFGHVVIDTTRASLWRFRNHERVHVRQYEQWGVLFFLAYPLSSLFQLFRGRSPYWHNRFEIQAYTRQGGNADERERTAPEA